MSRPRKITKYDNTMIEYFQMGLEPFQVYEKINYQQLLKDEPPIISRKTIYNRYNEWVHNGRQGEVELIRKEILEDGTIVSYWKDKQ
jgi:hypothetical protein